MDLPVDYEHQSVVQPLGYAGPIPAAGWILHIVYVEGEGVYGAIDLTERAAEMVLACAS